MRADTHSLDCFHFLFLLDAMQRELFMQNECAIKKKIEIEIISIIENIIWFCGLCLHSLRFECTEDWNSNKNYC